MVVCFPSMLKTLDSLSSTRGTMKGEEEDENSECVKGLIVRAKSTHLLEEKYEHKSS